MVPAQSQCWSVSIGSHPITMLECFYWFPPNHNAGVFLLVPTQSQCWSVSIGSHPITMLECFYWFPPNHSTGVFLLVPTKMHYSSLILISYTFSQAHDIEVYCFLVLHQKVFNLMEDINIGTILSYVICICINVLIFVSICICKYVRV